MGKRYEELETLKGICYAWLDGIIPAAEMVVRLEAHGLCNRNTLVTEIGVKLEEALDDFDVRRVMSQLNDLYCDSSLKGLGYIQTMIENDEGRLLDYDLDPESLREFELLYYSIMGEWQPINLLTAQEETYLLK